MPSFIRIRVQRFILFLLLGVLALVNFELSVFNFKNVDVAIKRSKPGHLTRLPTKTTLTRTAKVLAQCPQLPKNISNHIDIDVEKLNATNDEDLQLVQPGGHYKPVDCEARHRVAIIVPYRNRETQLPVFLRYIHPYLQKKQLEYRMFVVEQTQEETFNKAVMMNTGFVEANKLQDYDCFIFHDVDLLPENDGISYTCEKSPVHLSVAIDARGYKLSYPTSYGGVTGFSPDHFKKVNGFSNLYFGWGGEDDDMYFRVTNSRLKVFRYSRQLGRYKKLKHEKSKQNPHKMLLFKTMNARQSTDGLNSLKSYVVKKKFKRLYTWILVRINRTEIIDSEPIHKQSFKNQRIN